LDVDSLKKNPKKKKKDTFGFFLQMFFFVQGLLLPLNFNFFGAHKCCRRRRPSINDPCGGEEGRGSLGKRERERERTAGNACLAL